MLLPRLRLEGVGPALSDPLRAAFAGAAVLPLREFRPVAGRAAGTIRAGWDGPSLCLLADLDRPSPATIATADHQKIWRLGDCFEIFLKRPDAPSYLEFHVSPSGHILQLRFPGPRTREDRDLTADGTVRKFALPGKWFESAAEIRPDRSGWTVFARIDLAALEMAAGSLAGERYAFAFCTCNFTRKPSYHASTSEMKIPEVHLHSQWRQAECADGAP